MLNYLKIYGTFGILAGAVSNHTISQAHPKHLTHHQQVGKNVIQIKHRTFFVRFNTIRTNFSNFNVFIQVLSRESVLGAGILLGGGAAGAIGAYKLGTILF